MRFSGPLLFSVLLVLSSCNSSSPDPKKADDKKADAIQQAVAPEVRSDYASGDITKACKETIAQANASIEALVKIPIAEKNADNTLLAFETMMANLSDRSTPLTFMGYVSTNPDISAEGSQCESDVGQLYVNIYTRRNLYESLSAAVPRNADETRLLKKTLEGFESNGLKLSDEKLTQVRDLKGKLSDLENQFSKNLNADHTTVLFTLDELEGVPASYVGSLKKDPSGLLIVNTKESDYPIIMQNAVKPETRKKMMIADLNRGVPDNVKLMTDAVAVRAQIAQLMGYKTWADYRIEGRMAQNSATVLEFLNGLKDKLAKRNQEDLNRVLKFKQESVPGATQLDQWDTSYYSYQLQKRDYSLDTEKIREYFPADVVIAGLFQVYSKMLGVHYVEVKDAKVWSPDVKMYEIQNESDNQVVGYFYTDFYPRDGKYGHAAAFPIISGRLLENGTYSLPVSAIVANLNAPIDGKPALLGHGDVETIFHEFGHIMHQTLTRAKYASLAGSGVAQDFVEAPSQMLENWVWSPEVLNMLSGHYLDHSQKLPQDLLQKMIAAREFNQGAAYTKQLLYALFDMSIHTQDGPVDVNQTYLDLYQKIVGQTPLAGTNFPASFGHLMGGYDAGYYGYLWSEVYAQDMFTQFPADNLMSPEVGARYRKSILEQGNMKEALDLLREFLGREPNSDAFFKKLHI